MATRGRPKTTSEGWLFKALEGFAFELAPKSTLRVGDHFLVDGVLKTVTARSSKDSVVVLAYGSKGDVEILEEDIQVLAIRPKEVQVSQDIPTPEND